jgi:cellulose synthase (UDP-forming)
VRVEAPRLLPAWRIKHPKEGRMAGWLRALAWTATAAVCALFATLPIGIDAQLLLALSCIAAMLVLWWAPREGLPKHIFLALGTFVVLRYVYWRTTTTLPPAGLSLDFAFGLLLYGAEMYCVLVLTLSLFIIADPVPPRHATKFDDAQLPTVDIFVPSYNEEPDLLAATLAAAKALDYPSDKLTVFLLDDGGTDAKVNSTDPRVSLPAQRRRATLSQLSEKLDVKYIARARNEHAKAGNLNAGMAASTGELVAIFDADHAPFRAFLQETVGFFLEDPKLFLVQTPHVFLNPDPIEKNLRTFKGMPSENEMFYGVIQRGLDRWNASFFCGSAAVLRRRALDSVGGFAGVTITEDCETALELHANGWNSIYVEKPLIAGLQPETLSSFIGQRSRWCRGMIQILILKNPLLRRGLSFAQRICYVSNPLFWFFPIPRLVFTFAPLLYIFFSLRIYVANVDQMFAYTVTYLIVNIMIQNYLYGRVRWPWVSELYEYVQSIYLFRAIFTVILNPRKPTFNVTDKSLTLEEDQLSELSQPYFGVFFLLLSAAAVGVWRLATEPTFNDLLAVVMGWNALNLIITGAALGVVSERRELRRAQRLDVRRCGLLISGSSEVPVIIEDVSRGGARVRTIDGGLPVRREGETIGTLVVDQVYGEMAVRSVAVMIRRIDAEQGDDLYGLQFIQTSPAQMRLVADLMYGDFMVLDQHREGRRKQKNIFLGTVQFAGWGLRYSLRACGFVLKPRKKPAKGDGARPQAAPAAKPSASPLAEMATRMAAAQPAAEPNATPADASIHRKAAS